MGIFNGIIGKKPMFGQVPGMMQPEMQQPMMQPGAMQPPLQAPMQAPMTAKPNWAGIAADFVSGMAGQPGQFAERQQHERAMQQRQQMAEQDRMTRREDMQWEWQNKPQQSPRVNDTEVDYNFWKGKADSGEITQEQFNDKIFAPKFVVDQATGQTIRIGGAPSYKPAPKGVTFTPIEGGPVVNQPGNFRPSGY